MPIVTLPLSPGGALVSVFVGVSLPRATALQAAGQPIPAAQPGQFLIDTGASSTVIDRRLVQALGLTATNTVQCHTAGGGNPQNFNQYDVGLILPLPSAPHAHILRITIPVLESDFTQQGFDGLIGRDVLSQCLFAYNGPGGHIAIAV
jgi:hypothetical protein